MRRYTALCCRKGKIVAMPHPAPTNPPEPDLPLAHPLQQAIDASSLFRRVAEASDVADKRIYAACLSREVRETQAACRERFGRLPDAIAVLTRKGHFTRLGRLRHEAGLAKLSLSKGIPMISVAKAATDPGGVLVVFGAGARSRAVMLAEHGVRQFLWAQDPNFPIASLGQGPFTDYYKRFEEKLNWLYDHLADEESRLTLAAILKHRATRDSGYIRLALYPEYEHPLAGTRHGDIVIDGGAFDGATSLAFARRAGRTGRVYAFEPEAENMRRLQQKLAEPAHARVSRRITPVRAGLGARAGQAHTEGAGGAARVHADAKRSDASFDVTTIDAFVERERLSRVDVISLDVEGMEQAVLNGARETLARFRPKLHVSVYHQLGDLPSIPRWVHGLDLGYSLYLGHHDPFYMEIDLYAVPGERPR